MQDQAPTPETQNPQGEPEDLGSLDAAAAAFAARLEPAQEAQTEEAEPDPESAEETEPEADEADPDEESEAGELVEVEIEGKTYKVPPELQKGYLRQADYSRAMNAVTEKEKAYTSRIELIDQMEKTADERSEALAQVKLIDERIKAYDGVDWAKAKADSPAEAAMAAIELMQLKDARKEAVNAAAQVARKLTEGKERLLSEKRADMEKALSKSLKGWGDEMGAQVSRYAVESGWSVEALRNLTDPNVVVALDKARRFDALQKSKEGLKAKAKDAPQVVKPGAARPRTDARQEAIGRLRNSGSMDDAAAAFLSRMK